MEARLSDHRRLAKAHLRPEYTILKVHDSRVGGYVYELLEDGVAVAWGSWLDMLTIREEMIAGTA